VALGLPSEPPSPFLPSMLRLFDDVRPGESARMLANPTIPAMLRDKRTLGAADEERVLQDWALRMQADRRGIKGKISKAQLHARIETNRRIDLQNRARDTVERLRLDVSMNAAVPGFVERHQQDPFALPTERVLVTFAEGIEHSVLTRSPGSNGWNELAGDYFDMQHALIGAAYCDVFTCDARTAARLNGVREALGFEPPLALGSDAEAFLDALIATYR